MKHILEYPIDSEIIYMFWLAIAHLTSFLLPKSTNITFPQSIIRTNGKQKDNIFACGSKKAVGLNTAFRPRIVPTHSMYPNMFQERVVYIDEYRLVS